MDWLQALEEHIPRSPAEAIAWDAIEPLFAPTCFSQMRSIPQNPAFHGEGDVLTHTKLVCRELTALDAFHALPRRERTALFLAALLHDIGKVATTVLEDGIWHSPHHAATGSQLAREFLWLECGLCGTPDAVALRETVCALIRYHMLPTRLMDQPEPERKARTLAAIGALAPGFSWNLLCLLAQADVRGRIAPDVEELLAQVQLCRMLAQEAGCLAQPYPFADACVRHAYLSGRNVQPDQTLYDGTWGEVVMMSGLPGTGKDTWIAKNLPGLPMVSLDDIRRMLRISPTDNQGRVLQAAQEQARVLLRQKQPFVWNTTGLMKDTRQKQLRLFERYGARVRIVYLETGWTRRAEQNTGRAEPVPESAVCRMLARIALPLPDEAQRVEWLCV